MHADNTAHLITAASQRHELTRSKAIRAVRELDAAGTTVTFESVAGAAGVSRSWLYTQPDIRDEIQRLRDLGRRAPGTRHIGAGTPPQQRRIPAAPTGSHHRPQPGTGPGQPAAAPPARPSPRTGPRRQHPPRSRASVPTIKTKPPSDNNRSLLTTTISRHADSSKTLSPTSPPRSGHRMKKRL
jgi:hypothetical protein